MRISLWQQFSSNHSAGYWVIGTFKTVEDAQHAYREMRGILQKLDQWNRENPEEYDQVWDSKKIEPLPPEKEIAEQYQIEWSSPIDWWPDYLQTEKTEAEKIGEGLINEALSLVGNLVLISNPAETWMSWKPFKGLLEHFGAEISGYDQYFVEESGFFNTHTIKSEFRFTAPDNAVADELETAINTYLEGPHVSETNPPPWQDDEANFQAILGKSQYLDAEAVTAIQQKWLDRYSFGIDIPSLQSNREIMLVNRLAISPSDPNYHRLERDGLDFQFINLEFENHELGLAALIAYLEVKGCTNIHLGYHYVPIEGNKGDDE